MKSDEMRTSVHSELSKLHLIYEALESIGLLRCTLLVNHVFILKIV